MIPSRPGWKQYSAPPDRFLGPAQSHPDRELLAASAAPPEVLKEVIDILKVAMPMFLAMVTSWKRGGGGQLLGPGGGKGHYSHYIVIISGAVVIKNEYENIQHQYTSVMFLDWFIFVLLLINMIIYTIYYMYTL